MTHRIMPPEKRIIKVKKMKTIKPAGYRDVPTGEVEIKKVRDDKGNLEDREIPVTRRVVFDAIREEVEEPREVWAVDHYLSETEFETHEFATRKAAEAFCREAK